jgi:dipeptidyl aminopeptidase/acylaminoacyl peptidase
MIAGLGKVAALTGAVLLVLALPARALSPFTADDVFQLAWTSSPLVDRKGERVLYLRHSMDIMRDQPRSNLWQVNMDGSEHRPVTTGPDSISSPALAPDGKRVAYVRRGDTGPQLFVSWLDSAQTAQLTRVPYPPANLAWLPDGKWLAFRMLVPGEAPTARPCISPPTAIPTGTRIPRTRTCTG